MDVEPMNVGTMWVGRLRPLRRRTAGAQVAVVDLCGRWTSTYSYVSSGRGEQENTHRVEFEAAGARLIGRSAPTPIGTLELDLGVDGLLATGSWTERTARDGYYAGAVFHGVVQLVIDPVGRSMRGRWLGPDREFVVGSGPWRFDRERSGDR